MKKRLIASITSFMLMATTAFCGLSAPAYASSSTDSSITEIPASPDLSFYRDSETGHIYTEDIDPGYTSKSTSDKISPNSVTIPSAWPSASSSAISDIRSKYPTTRSQSPYGTCWAFASTACAEFDMITDGYTNKYNTDYSEFQLAYFQYHTQNDRFGGLDDDSVSTTGTSTVYYNYNNFSAPSYLTTGGNFIYAMMTAAQWKTFTSESNVPYTTSINNPFTTLSSSAAVADQAKLTDVRFLDIKNDRNSVKEAIMNNGAVHISFCANDSYCSTYNNLTLYYNPYDVSTNHDVVIVGWDDSISRYCFPSNRRPSGDGAWLVRNTWSTDDSSSSYATYFYMSYYDNSLAQTAYSSEYVPANQYQYLYQYDGSISHGYLTTKGVANVFTAQGPDSSVSEELKAVMLSFTSQTNVNYKIEVYTGWQSESNPGYLQSSATTTGSTDKKGIYTIPLKNSVILAPGEKYAIVVTSLNGNVNFDLENTVNRTYIDSNGTTQNWFKSTASLDPGESFIVKDGVWTDIYDKGWHQSSAGGYGNVCLKAITNKAYTKKYTITYIMDDGVNSTANPNGYLSTYTGSCTLQNPTRSGYHFAGWYTDSAFKNKVTAINYNNKSNLTLYAKWCSNSNSSTTRIISCANKSSSGSYKIVCSNCGITKGSGTIPAIASIKLNYTKLVYNGSNRNPVPVITATDGTTLVAGTDYNYSYNKSSRANVGRYYVKITFKGKYNESAKTLYYSVVPKAPATASAKLYGYNDIKVSWSKCTGATGYYVYYKKASATTYTNYKITTARSLKFANLAGNTKYNFKIVPYFKSGNTKYKSNKSKVVSTTTLKKLNQPTITKNSAGKVSLNWQCISGASGYQVWWSSKKAGTYTKLCDFSNAYIGVTFTVGKNVQYWYKTRAYKTVDGKKIYGPWSNPKAYTLK